MKTSRIATPEELDKFATHIKDTTKDLGKGRFNNSIKAGQTRVDNWAKRILKKS